MFLLAYGTTSASQSVIIASWNLWNLRTNTDVQERAEVIQQFDVIALQEIKSIDGLENLLACVEAISVEDWKFIKSPLVGEGDAAKFYAFMYRTASVAYIEESSGVYQELMPDDFAREPFYASFRAGEFDFTLVTVHAIWGDSPALRTAECQRLADVWKHIQSRDLLENDIVLLGDFNRDRPTHSAFEPMTQAGIVPLLFGSTTWTTYSTKTTSIGANWYDNIWVDLAHTGKEFTGESGVDYVYLRYFSEAEWPHLEVRKRISDHCPVWAIFDTTTDDDPSNKIAESSE